MSLFRIAPYQTGQVLPILFEKMCTKEGKTYLGHNSVYLGVYGQRKFRTACLSKVTLG